MERHNIEWKSSWKDEYLAWVCGFANAHGGVLEIGRRDDGVSLGLQTPRNCWKTCPTKSAVPRAS